jgi:hypothetical protein
VDCFQQELKRGGIKTFYKAFEIMALRAFVVNAFGFLCFEFGKKLVY